MLTRSTVAFNLITYPVVDGNQVDERFGLLTTNEIAADNQTLGKTHHHFNLEGVEAQGSFSRRICSYESSSSEAI